MLKKSIKTHPTLTTIQQLAENRKYLECRQKNHGLKRFMAFISKVIKKRISKIISRFDVPKIPPHMINQLGIEKEATSTN